MALFVLYLWLISQGSQTLRLRNFQWQDDGKEQIPSICWHLRKDWRKPPETCQVSRWPPEIRTKGTSVQFHQTDRHLIPGDGICAIYLLIAPVSQIFVVMGCNITPTIHWPIPAAAAGLVRRFAAFNYAWRPDLWLRTWYRESMFLIAVHNHGATWPPAGRTAGRLATKQLKHLNIKRHPNCQQHVVTQPSLRRRVQKQINIIHYLKHVHMNVPLCMPGRILWYWATFLDRRFARVVWSVENRGLVWIAVSPVEGHTHTHHTHTQPHTTHTPHTHIQCV
jgi:hypothetical protein